MAKLVWAGDGPALSRRVERAAPEVPSPHTAVILGGNSRDRGGCIVQAAVVSHTEMHGCI